MGTQTDTRVFMRVVRVEEEGIVSIAVETLFPDTSVCWFPWVLIAPGPYAPSECQQTLGQDFCTL